MFKPMRDRIAQKLESRTLPTLEEFFNGLSQLLLQYSYFGVFLISFIGAASIIVPIPYTLIIFTLSLSGQWNSTLLIIASGFGSALGELTGYALGYFGRHIISEERQKKMTYLVRLFDRYGPLAIFVFALTPLPDDLLFIPLGIMKYKLYKAFIPSLIGKLLMVFIIVNSGSMAGDFLVGVFGESGSIWGMIITTILLVIVLILLYRIDWEKLLKKYVGERGEIKVESDC
jgi:membrane protein YqaA with SNARE-associated domain